MYTFLYRLQEGRGGSALRAAWKKPGDTKFEIIPSSAFYYKSNIPEPKVTVLDTEKYNPNKHSK